MLLIWPVIRATVPEAIKSSYTTLSCQMHRVLLQFNGNFRLPFRWFYGEVMDNRKNVQHHYCLILIWRHTGCTMRHPLLTTVGIYLFTAGMIITWMVGLSWSMVPPFCFKVREIILNLLLQVKFSFPDTIQDCQTASSAKISTSTCLLTRWKQVHFSLKTSAFKKNHAFKKKVNKNTHFNQNHHHQKSSSIWQFV